MCRAGAAAEPSPCPLFRAASTMFVSLPFGFATDKG